VSETNATRPLSPRQLAALIEAERAEVPFVHWRTGTGELKILILDRDRKQITIGRREHCDISLSWDSEVSRLHGFLEPVGEEWTLVDDGMSTNGSFLHGTRIHGRQRLHNRDQLCFGNTYVVYREPSDSEASDSTARAAGAPNVVPLAEMQRKVLIALCRPLIASAAATPATNPQIAAEVFLSVDAVKAHLRKLFERFDLDRFPQNEKRSRLAATVLDSGLLSRHDF
jgi:DNA-binding CsgD family transcriptional regulator